MVQLGRFKLPIPSSGLMFLIAGLAVGNYSYENYQQKYLNRGPSSKNGMPQSIAVPAMDNDEEIKFKPTSDSAHPLDPISALEMQLIARIVRAYNTSSVWQFKCIGLREPDKDLMLPYYEMRKTPPAGLIPRKAKVLIADPVIRQPIFVIVNLSEGEVESWTEAKPGQKVATTTYEDMDLATELAFNDTEVADRFRKLGYNDKSGIVVDTWPAAFVADNPIYAQANKMLQLYFYAIKGKGNNYFAHPFNFVVYVELGPNAGVRGVENLPIQQDSDTSDQHGSSVPKTDAEYLADSLPANAIRRDINRLIISQPDGPSFKVNGNEVTWQNFNFRLGYNPREGHYLNTNTYDDKGKIRSLMYRMAISEVYVSYGDPRPPLHHKSSFDEGNAELGGCLISLPVHQFCRGNAYYFQSNHHDEQVNTWITRRTLCMVEEDAGILWAHYDDSSGKTEAVRNQRLSLTSLVSIGNVDYLISWRFYQDATIELGIKVTGILSTNLMAIDVKAPSFGNLMMPQVYTENYQHFFAVRMDADIDGKDNTVSVDDKVCLSDTIGVDNPFGNGITTKSVNLNTPAEAATDTLPNRCWKISNPNKVENKLNGKPTSWKLVPDGPSPSMLTPDSPMLPSRLEWTKHNVWVLPYNVDQMYAAGQYLDDGVAEWTRQYADANITNSDVVLWHVFNYVHIPTVEDWPVLSARDEIGFKLRPSNFFKQNPSLYAPRAKEMTQLDGISVGINADVNMHVPIEL